jgi:predicted ATPase
MSHPFGDLLSQHIHRKHGLSQARLAAGILQDPSTIGKMCKGERLTGPQARERVLAIISWLHGQAALTSSEEANALLIAAGMAPLRDGEPADRPLMPQLRPPMSERTTTTAPFLSVARKTNLPAPLTSFVGREPELVEITARITTQRLVTLTGVGGVGKTRTALEVVRRLIEQDDSNQPAFADGVWFVALQAVDAPARMVADIADAIRCPPPGAADAREHLLAYLRTRRLLLVLDNFEHLRDGADLLPAILAAAPQAKLLVTSRAALNLEEEWRYPLSGLSLDTGDGAGEAAPSSAARLFVARARRVAPAFELAAERAGVERICRLVEGIPLAIELAATWTRVLSCAVIADEIVSNAALLTSDMRNAPDRHRSMGAVFDHSWALLSQEERRVFARLAIFRGGFTHQAAAAVAGASLPLLSALIDKSLLRSDETGRFSVHELLRQYAQEQLERDAEDVHHTCDLHSAYYASFLEARAEAITRAMQQRILREVAAELHNIRAAWSWAVRQLHVGYIQRAAYTLYQFIDFRGPYREGEELFEQAIAALETIERSQQNDSVLAVLCALCGWNYIRTGEYAKSAAVFERSRALFAAMNAAPPAGFGTDPLMGLALLATVRGDYAGAIALAEAACAQAEDRNDLDNLQIGNYVQASAYCSLGQYSAAQEQAMRAYRLASTDYNQAMMAYILVVLGDVARAEGQLETAEHHYQHCHELQSKLANVEGMAVARVRLAELASSQRDYDRAAIFFEQSIALYQTIHDPGGLAKSLLGLGDVALARGNDAHACNCFRESLKLAMEIRWLPLILLQFTAIGELLYRCGDLQLARTSWAVVASHPAAESTMQTRARTNLVLASAHAALQHAALEDHPQDPS